MNNHPHQDVLLGCTIYVCSRTEQCPHQFPAHSELWVHPVASLRAQGGVHIL